MKPLVKIKHGSHLYGTNTPASDLDFKGVHIPAASEILMQRADRTLDKGVKVSDGLKNSAEDTDDQSYPLKKFLEMLVAGDTTATEILFAPEDAIVLQAPEWPVIRAAAKELINRQCRGFVGYCTRQAAKYGIKGSRVAVARDIVAVLTLFNEQTPQAKLSSIEETLVAFCWKHEFASIKTLATGQNGELLHLEVLDRMVPFTATIKTAYDLYSKIWHNYGERARLAESNEGVDWKAVSHAVRVANQAIELLTTGHITFPRPEAIELLEIKQGRQEYKTVATHLEFLVEEVERVALISKLPEKSSDLALTGMVLHYYSQPIVEMFSMGKSNAASKR